MLDGAFSEVESVIEEFIRGYGLEPLSAGDVSSKETSEDGQAKGQGSSSQLESCLFRWGP